MKCLCELYEVSRSGYYRWRNSIAAIKKPDLSFLVLNSFLESEKAYGTRRIREDLREKGVYVSKATISSIMKELYISSSHHKLKFKKKKNSPKIYVENILNRDFAPGRKDKFWASDTTYIKSRRGWVYLCAVIDLGFKEVIGWNISNRNDSHLVCSSLNSALFKRAYPRDVIFHSDQGSEFQSQEVSSLLKENGFIRSVSRRGNCYDNAPVESFFKTLKVELIRGLKTHTLELEQIKKECFNYIEGFYNTKSRHSGLDNLSPLEYEQRAR